MKATGIVRRIDDLGRVVIPKEIRRNMRIRNGDPLEIFIESSGEIILKKYSPIGQLSDMAREYAESISETLLLPVLVSDRDNIIAVCGANKKIFWTNPLGCWLNRPWKVAALFSITMTTVARTEISSTMTTVRTNTAFAAN